MSAHPNSALRTTRVLAVGAAAVALTVVGASLALAPSLLSVVGGGALAVGLVALVRRTSNGTPPAPFPGPGAIPAPPRPRAEKVLYRPLARSGS